MSILILILLGLAFGSFINAFVWRFYEQNRLEKGKGKREKGKPVNLSILNGRSVCPNCHHELAWYDLIPLFSWIWLGGKCRYCYKPISWQYPMVELATALIFVVSYLSLRPISGLEWFQFASWLVLLIGLFALVVYDIRWMLLPNKIVLVLSIIAAVSAVVSSIWASDINLIIGPFLGALTLGGLFYLLFIISKGTWIGGGDVKLGFLLGIIAGGVTKSLLLLFLASLAGSIIAIPLILTGKAKAKTRVPFGPFLILGCILVVLFSTLILNWYTHLFDLS